MQAAIVKFLLVRLKTAVIEEIIDFVLDALARRDDSKLNSRSLKSAKAVVRGSPKGANVDELKHESAKPKPKSKRKPRTKKP